MIYNENQFPYASDSLQTPDNLFTISDSTYQCDPDLSFTPLADNSTSYHNTDVDVTVLTPNFSSTPCADPPTPVSASQIPSSSTESLPPLLMITLPHLIILIQILNVYPPDIKSNQNG